MRLGSSNLASTPFRPYIKWLLLSALTLPGLYVLLNWQLNRGTGLTQTFLQGVGVNRTTLVERRTRTVDLTILQEDERLPRRFFTIRWNGVWYIPQGGLYDHGLGRRRPRDMENRRSPGPGKFRGRSREQNGVTKPWLSSD